MTAPLSVKICKNYKSGETCILCVHSNKLKIKWIWIITIKRLRWQWNTEWIVLYSFRLKRKHWMEIKLSIQRSFASGSCLLVIIHIHLIFYLLECMCIYPRMVDNYKHCSLICQALPFNIGLYSSTTQSNSTCSMHFLWQTATLRLHEDIYEYHEQNHHGFIMSSATGSGIEHI